MQVALEQPALKQQEQPTEQHGQTSDQQGHLAAIAKGDAPEGDDESKAESFSTAQENPW